MTAGGDALAAAGVLVVVALAAVAVDVALVPVAVLVGAVGAVGLELFASVRAARVRAVWTRPGVRAVAVALGVVVVALAAVAVPVWGLNALAGGLLAYLALLALVAAGVLPPSTDWFDRDAN